MPIDPKTLSGPEPDEQPPTEAAASAEPPKRTRRKKSEMIADAVVPGMDDEVEIKDAGSGAKIKRPWRVAVEMFRDGKATWLDKPQEYAFLKYEQQRAEGAFSAGAAAAHSDTCEDPANPEPDRSEIADEARENNRKAEMETLGQHDESGQMIAPEGAELGDEVIIGPDVYTVGHGNALVKGIVAKDGEIVQAQRRWKRELGAPDGPFIAEKISRPSVEQRAGALEQGPTPDDRVKQANYGSNGKSDDIKVETQRLPREQEDLGDGMIKIGTGVLEKIGLPQAEQYAAASQLQVGPISASRIVFDDGRRDTVQFSDGRTGEVITAAVEGFELLDNTVEFIAARFRGQLVAFLAATGALKQPVS